MIARVSKGDRYVWPAFDAEGKPAPVAVVVTRVARDQSWADIRCTVPGTTWTKRQPLPLSATFQRVEAGSA